MTEQRTDRADLARVLQRVLTDAKFGHVAEVRLSGDGRTVFVEVENGTAGYRFIDGKPAELVYGRGTIQVCPTEREFSRNGEVDRVLVTANSVRKPGHRYTGPATRTFRRRNQTHHSGDAISMDFNVAGIVRAVGDLIALRRESARKDFAEYERDAESRDAREAAVAELRARGVLDPDGDGYCERRATPFGKATWWVGDHGRIKVELSDLSVGQATALFGLLSTEAASGQ